MSLPTSSFNTDLTANKIRQTYVRGYMDISGGDLNLQNGSFNMFNGGGDIKFRVSNDHFTVQSYPSLQYVDVSLSRLILLNNVSGNVDDSLSVINQRITGITYNATLDQTVIDNGILATGQVFFNNDVSMVGGNLYIKKNLTVDGNIYLTNQLPYFLPNTYPTFANQLATKGYVDAYGGGVLLGSNNVWTGNNTFSVYLPTWTGVGGPTQGNQFATKSYVDTNGGSVLLGSNNVWTGNNAFSVSLPTWTGVGGPTQGNQFATKSYVDTNGSTLLLSSNNTFSGNNTFNGNTTFNTDISLNGNLSISGTIFQQVPAVGFDGGFPGTDFTLTPKLDAGFYI